MPLSAGTRLGPYVIASSGDAMHSPTLTARATQMGMIIGTAAYMAPEQARGKGADRRADIWAFGVVLYEMLTGGRAFDGDDISVTLASVLKEDVKWDRLPSDLPASVRRLLRRCLEKDPKRRLSAIGDARLELDEPAEPEDTAAGGAAARAVTGTRERIAWGSAVAIALVAGAAATWALRPIPVPPETRLEITTFPVSTTGGMVPRWRKDGTELYYLAPDGTLMAVSMVTSGQVPEMGAPAALFRPHIVYGGSPPVGITWQYDVARDGRFLINVTVGDAVTAPITVIQHWNPGSPR